MSELTKIPGQVSVGVIAGHIEATSTAPNSIGQQVKMAGSSVMFYIKPEVAKQWLPVITKIAESGE